jgi:hypothetical protein
MRALALDKRTAVFIQQKLEQWSQHSQSSYAIVKLEMAGNILKSFHQWANGKQTVGAFQVTNRNNETFYLLLIDWHRNDNYYLVIYLLDKSSTAAEIHYTEENLTGSLELLWTYNPLKRDGLNAERKAYFQQIFGSTTMQIPLPQTITETDNFLNEIFNLARNRLRVDRITELFNL